MGVTTVFISPSAAFYMADPDPSVIDLPPDAVRELRPVPLLGVDCGTGDRTVVCAARGHNDGVIEIVGVCEYTGDADSDGGECD